MASSTIKIDKINPTSKSVNLRRNTSWVNPYTGPDWDFVTGTVYDSNLPDANTAAYATGSQGVKFIGSGADNLFSGGNGSDTMFGGAGKDYLFGNNGNDTLDGGDGNDFLIGGNDNDAIFGGSGNDLIIGDTRINSNGALIDTGAGNDTLVGGSGIDTLYGGAGADVLYGDGTGNESKRDGNDVLFGGLGNDQLYGRGGNDYLDGGAINAAGARGVPMSNDGNDLLNGGSGDDTLRGGSGIDTLTGGSGKDIFVFFKGDAPTGTNIDTITDFEFGKDSIFLDYIPGNVSASKPLVITATENGQAGVTLSFDYKTGQAGDTIDYQIFLKYSNSLTSSQLFSSDGKLKLDAINQMLWTADLSAVQYT